MPIRTLDLDRLADQVGNLYEATVILSKRARQIATNKKMELDEKLSYFEGFETDLDDARMNEEQRRISIEHEVMPKPEEISIDEMFEHEIYYRKTSEELPAEE
jgi:hypothetical protein